MANRLHDGAAQPIYGWAHDRIAANLKAQAVRNILSLRREWLQDYGDPRRSLEDECGYPPIHQALDARFYQDLYDREAIPARVDEVWPKECWQAPPEVYESERGKINTAFERALADSDARLRGEANWFKEDDSSLIQNELLLRADILSGIGQYGGILLGLDDGLEMHQPAAGISEAGSMPAEVEYKEQDEDDAAMQKLGFKRKIVASMKAATSNGHSAVPGNGRKLPPRWQLTRNAGMVQGRQLLYVKPLSEAFCRVNRIESNRGSSRYGQPITYLVTLWDPSMSYLGSGVSWSTMTVHWTRIVHLADTIHTAGSSEVFAVPRKRPVLNHLLALRKVHHSAGEGYWKAVFAWLFLETHPQLGGDVDIDKEALRDEFEQMENGLSRMMALRGMSAKSVPLSLSDPTSHVNVQVEAVCIKAGVPVPVFKGYEVGELAGSMNTDTWNGRINGRNKNYTSPRVIAPYYNRQIWLGVLPMPESGGFKADWPDLSNLSAEKKAAVLAQRTQALASYQSANLEQTYPLQKWLVDEFGKTEEEAEAILQEALGFAQGEQGPEEPEQVQSPPDEDKPDEGDTGEFEEPREEGEQNVLGNVRMCWGKPCPEGTTQEYQLDAESVRVLRAYGDLDDDQFADDVAAGDDAPLKLARIGRQAHGSSAPAAGAAHMDKATAEQLRSELESELDKAEDSAQHFGDEYGGRKGVRMLRKSIKALDAQIRRHK